MEISQAYDVLSDDSKRRNYDQFGEEGINGNPNQGHGGGFHDNDIFKHFFRGHQGPQKGHNNEARTEISLQDAYKGSSFELAFNLMRNCKSCKGSGSEDGKKHNCPTCNGTGRLIQRIFLGAGMFQEVQQPCGKCGGKGKIITNKCKTCGGARVTKENKSFTLNVEKGAPRKFEIVFHGEADHVPDREPGDLIVHVTESKKNNWGYRRLGNNLFRTEVLSEKEALNGGWKRDIPCLDGESNITISRPAGTRVTPGEVEKIKGQGMPILNNDDEHGDLYIEYVVIFRGKLPKDEL